MSGSVRPSHELKTESIEHAIARTVAVVLIATTYAGVPIRSIVDRGIAVGTVRIPLDFVSLMIMHFMLVYIYKGAVRVTRRAHHVIVSMAQRAGIYSPTAIHSVLDANNKKRLLRKYGFNVGNSRDIERKFYIHMQRIPLSNRKRHAELNLAKRIADKNMRFDKLKSHKLV